jgi:predicted aldo/keto reductase-like oxidoreductase
MSDVHSDRTPCGSRRNFLKTAAVTGTAASALVTGEAAALAAPPESQASPLPTVTLGKTGQKISALGLGTAVPFQPSFLLAALKAGVRYLDCSEVYEGGNSEKLVGSMLQRSGLRKEVYLVTKNKNGKVGGPGAYQAFDKHLSASLERLKTDYVDCYFLHQIEGNEIALLSDPDVKLAFEKLKAAGKIRFCGISSHDRLLPEIVTAAAESGWIDQIMIQYNYRTMNGDAIRRALDAAAKANLGVVAMKTQGGAGSFPDSDPSPKFNEFMEKGFKKQQAAIKTVFAEHRVHAIVSEMTNRDMLRDNIAAASNPTLSARDQQRLEEHRQATDHLYCRGCGHHCEPAAGGMAVADILRYYRYYEVYGKRQRARELYQELPPEARDVSAANLAAAQSACPHHLPIASLIHRADERLS